MRKYFLPIVLLVLLLMPVALAAGNVKINDFSANVTNGTLPLHTRFIGDVTGNVTSWRWIFENIGTGATTYSGSNITTHHNFGKPGIYNVTLNVWGPDGNDTLLKPEYVTAMTTSIETTTKNKTTESENTNAKAKNETTKPIEPNTKTKKETTELVEPNTTTKKETTKSIGPNTKTKKEIVESVGTNTKAKKETTELVEPNTKTKKETTKLIGPNTKTKKEIVESVSIFMNPNWGSKDKQHYSNGYDEGYNIGAINGYNRGYNIGIKGSKYIGTGHINFAPRSTTSQDIGYAGGYNTGYDMEFFSGYNAGYNIYKKQYLE